MNVSEYYRRVGCNIEAANMEAIKCSELLCMHRATRRHVPEDHSLHIRRLQGLKYSYNIY
jgi:hypothetical protein